MPLSQNLPMVWVIIVAIGVLTVLIRLSFIALLGRMQVPMWLTRALRFVPVAALTAIITPEIFVRDGAIALWPVNVRLIAGLVAVLVAWRSKNTLLTIFAGMVTLWAFLAVQTVLR